MAKSEDSVAGRDGEPSKQQEETEKIDKQKSVDESESKDEDASASDDEAEDEFDFSFSYEPFYFSSASDRQVGVDLMWEAFNPYLRSRLWKDNKRLYTFIDSRGI